jgi:hypothetical protein
LFSCSHSLDNVFSKAPSEENEALDTLEDEYEEIESCVTIYIDPYSPENCIILKPSFGNKL